MDLQSWAAFAAIFAALVANFAMTSRRFDKLDAKIDGVEERLTRRMDVSDARMAAQDERLNGKTESLEERLVDKFESFEIRFDSKIDNLRTELREEMSAGFNRIDARLTMIEQRTFDLSTRLPPTPPAPIARQA